MLTWQSIFGEIALIVFKKLLFFLKIYFDDKYLNG